MLQHIVHPIMIYQRYCRCRYKVLLAMASTSAFFSEEGCSVRIGSNTAYYGYLSTQAYSEVALDVHDQVGEDLIQ